VTYEATIAVSGAHQVPVPTREEDGFRPDPDAIAAAITPRTRALMITNPNNPTGVAMSADELERSPPSPASMICGSSAMKSTRHCASTRRI